MKICAGFAGIWREVKKLAGRSNPGGAVNP
nr:MAG TPA: hypothetical protein [Caudoviricetes sp.]